MILKGSLGKTLVGSQMGGEKQEDLHTVNENEFSGVYGGELNKHLTQEGGTGASHDGAEEKGFSLQGKDYEGPENMHPDKLGVRNPDDITGSHTEVPHKN
jgi:hypothetical protein